MSATIANQGCRLRGYATEIQWQLTAHLPDALAVDTCASDVQAGRAHQVLARRHHAKPDLAIMVAGCRAQTGPASWAAA